MRKKIIGNNKKILIGVLVIFGALIGISISMQATGKSMGSSKLIEFTSTGSTINKVLDTIISIDNTSRTQSLEDHKYRSYFGTKLSDQYIKAELKSKLNTTGDVYISTKVTSKNIIIQYTIIITSLLCILLVYSLFGDRQFSRSFRLKVSLTMIASLLYQSILLVGSVSILIILGLFEIELWTISVISMLLLVSYFIQFIDIATLFKSQHKYMDKDHTRRMKKFLAKRNNGFGVLLIGLSVLFSSIYLVTALPFTFGIIILSLGMLTIYLNERYFLNIIFEIINIMVNKLAYLNKSKYWSK